MIGRSILPSVICLILFACKLPASIFYVDVNGANPVPPFADWSTAATDIQSAIDAASDGDEILVTNGVYATGGRVVYGSLTNRVVIDKAVTVQSVNGPAVTIIGGRQVPGLTNGDSAVRCVYLTNSAALIGFTVTNGATRDDGGNGSLINLNGGGIFCESTSAMVSNCVIIGNSARGWGGGVSSGTLNNCLIVSNTAFQGGGAYGGTLIGCEVTGNHAGSGGGINGGTVNRCKITQNRAGTYGGGSLGGILNNCVLFGNVASTNGGASGTTLNNCTLTGNSAQNSGGAGRSILNNCILCYNSADSEANYGNATLINRCTLNYCCTSPLPTNGVGNTIAEPQLADFSHIGMNSPCRAAGSPAYASGMDIDGEPWSSPPSIGCDEYISGAITGALNVAISTVALNVAAGYPISFIGQIFGHAGTSSWNFGDGLTITNQPYASHGWAVAADYPIVFSAFNDSNPGGISATVTVHVLDHPIHYVALTCTNPTPPFLAWSTAATNIQDAVDAWYPGAIILVSNGVYQTGGRVVYGSLTNRVVINKAATVQSVNGPSSTIIQGYQMPGSIYTGMTGTSAIRCVYLTNGAVLIGFTLTGGATTRSGDFYKEQSGGGVWCESTNAVLSNCVVVANTSFYSGGGAYSGTFNSCQFATNSGGTISFAIGGGAANGSVLNKCVLAFNNANAGGGATGSILNNCLVSNNVCVLSGGGISGGMANASVIVGNSTGSNGGGAANATLNNCMILNNLATNNGNGNGGGVVGGLLNNCVLAGNQARAGGGAAGGALNNCTIVNNSAIQYGGAAGGTFNNCIIYNNTAPNIASGNIYLVLNYCCTTPLTPNGTGNFTNAPLFVNLAGGDFRLQSSSPCINAGNNSFIPDSTDLDGNPRIIGGTVDIGAFEYPAPTSIISYAWLQQYGLPTDGSADYLDSDSDRLNNWQEWTAETNPTNAASVLLLASPEPGVSSIKVIWQSVSGVTYYLQRSTNLPDFNSIQSNLVGQANSTAFADTTATNEGPYFYRVGVQ
jgi:hypothetical protein